jgi:DNA-binding PadR family transcriptional regulator
MSVPLVILGFLREREYHGYELKKEIQRQMGNWTDIKFGSIYHALKKLVERGSVKIVGEERQSGRPDRTIYRITPKGREEFLKLIRNLVKRYQRIYLEFDVGLYFASYLPVPELQDLLATRLREIREERNMLEGVKKLPAHLKLPHISELIVDHSIFHLEAELKWMEMCLQRLQKEDLYSPPKYNQK